MNLKDEKTIAQMFSLKDNLKALRQSVANHMGYKLGSSPLMGVEVEMEFTDVIPPLELRLLETKPSALKRHLGEFISIHQEASLANGTELVLGPLPKEIIGDILQSVAKMPLPGLITSTRGSTHVHIDVRDFTAARLWNLCALYRIVEPVLFEWVDNTRLSNPFCRPWWLDGFSEFTPCKYQALNLLPSGYTLDSADGGLRFHQIRTKVFGSVEYRHFPELFPNRLELFLKWMDCIEELHESSLNLDVVELTERAVKLNDKSDNVMFLSRYIPKSIRHLVDAIGPDKLVKVMSPVITQMKCKFLVENRIDPYMKPGGDALKFFATEVTKRKKNVVRKKRLDDVLGNQLRPARPQPLDLVTAPWDDETPTRARDRYVQLRDELMEADPLPFAVDRIIREIERAPEVIFAAELVPQEDPF